MKGFNKLLSTINIQKNNIKLRIKIRKITKFYSRSKASCLH